MHINFYKKLSILSILLFTFYYHINDVDKTWNIKSYHDFKYSL